MLSLIKKALKLILLIVVTLAASWALGYSFAWSIVTSLTAISVGAAGLGFFGFVCSLFLLRLVYALAQIFLQKIEG